MNETNIHEESRVNESVLKSDTRLSLTKQLLNSEKEYLQNIESVFNCYAEPLRKCFSLTAEEHEKLFMPLDSIVSISRMLYTKLEEAVNFWDSTALCISNYFSKEFWSECIEYQESYRSCRNILKFKRETDNEFGNILLQQRQEAKHSLETLLYLPIQRLSDYHHYLKELLHETSSSHTDYKNLEKTTETARQTVEENDYTLEENECKMDKIQDLFPFDKLHLCCKSYNPKTRRKSAPALLIKSSTNRRKSSLENFSSEDPFSSDVSWNDLIKCDKAHSRLYIMETPVQVTVGLQNQERYFYLFNDMMIISKVRSKTCHKLKTKIRLCEMWISTCIEDVCETKKSHELSFVIGWPTTNVTATFSTPEMKDVWMGKLKELIFIEKEKEPPCAFPLRVNIYKQDGSHCMQTLLIKHYDTTEDVIELAFKQSELSINSHENYQLWVKMGKDDTPYPLIGHEYPYSIRMKPIRDSIQGETCHIPLDVSSYINHDKLANEKCKFILKDAKQKISGILDSNKRKKRKTAIINWSFKRLAMKPDNIFSTLTSPKRLSMKPDNTSALNSPVGKLFGVSLSELMHDDSLPKPILDMLQHLFHLGLFTSGIFRKSANARICREIKEKLNNDLNYDFQDVSVIVIASIIKDFIRNLPDSVLSSDMSDEWLEIVNLENDKDKITKTKKVLEKLPKANIVLLKHIMCLLWHVKEKSDSNSMTAFNLGICFSPTLFWPIYDSVSLALESEVSEKMPKLIQFFIENCDQIFGYDVLKLLGEPPENHHDSGEESDHSCDNIHRDDSSIGSMEKDSNSSPNLLNKGLQSSNNSSRDSGLMMSDSQLFSPNEDFENQKTFNKCIDFNSELSHYRLLAKDRTSYDQIDSSVYSAKVAIVKQEDNCNNLNLNKSISMDLIQAISLENTQVISHKKPIKITQSVSFDEDMGKISANFNLESVHKQLQPKLICQNAGDIQKENKARSPPMRPPRCRKGLASLPSFAKDQTVSSSKKHTEDKNLSNGLGKKYFSSKEETSRSTSPDQSSLKVLNNKKTYVASEAANQFSDDKSGFSYHFNTVDSFSKICDKTEDIFSNTSYENSKSQKLNTTRITDSNNYGSIISNNISNVGNKLETRNETETQNPHRSRISEIFNYDSFIKQKANVQNFNTLDKRKSSDSILNQSNDSILNADDSLNLSIKPTPPSYTETINRRNSAVIFYNDINKQDLYKHTVKSKLKCQNSLRKYNRDRLKLTKTINNDESPPPLPPKPHSHNIKQSHIEHCEMTKFVTDLKNSESLREESQFLDNLPYKNFGKTERFTEKHSKENLVLVNENNDTLKTEFDEYKSESKLSVSQLRALFSSGEPAPSKPIYIMPSRSHLEHSPEEKVQLNVKKRNETLRSLIKNLPGESYV